MQPSARPLSGLNILVTRPTSRADGLCRLIEIAGGNALHFAAIEIGEPADTRSRDFIRDHLTDFDIAIFISPTAVEKTLGLLTALPPKLKLAAIGSKTALSLTSSGLNLAIQPEGHDSESLLRHPEFQTKQISGKKIVIFRGEGGRQLLGDTLQQRGADIFYANMYRRSAPSDTSSLNDLLQQADVITTSSNEGLQNLYDMAEDKDILIRRLLVVPGTRALTLARSLGFARVIRAENATDKACMDALKFASLEINNKKTSHKS